MGQWGRGFTVRGRSFTDQGRGFLGQWGWGFMAKYGRGGLESECCMSVGAIFRVGAV